MSYSEGFTIYVDVETTAGYRQFYYSGVDHDDLGDQKVLRYGLGSGTIDGKWRTFTRDLQADLENAQPGIEILEVNGFKIRGSGRVDDVELRAR